MENTMEATTESQVGTTDTITDDVIDGGGLPSSVEEKEASLDGFKVTDELQQKLFKNGKLFGRFDNLEGMANALKSVEDKYANVMREIKTPPAEPQVNQEVDIATKAKPLIDEYVANGMELTDELLQKAVEQGLDVRDVKLAAIEIKEKVLRDRNLVQQAYDIVGGKDEYENMLIWGKQNLSDEDKEIFQKNIDEITELGTLAKSGKWAIKGLYAEYKSKSTTETQPQRIMGDGSASVGIRPYASQQEILRDKAYLNSQKGKNDLKALETYNKRMSKTPDSVVYNR